MFISILNFIKKLFGCKPKKSENLKWLEGRVAEGKRKLQEIEDEDLSDDDILDHLNK